MLAIVRPEAELAGNECGDIVMKTKMVACDDGVTCGV
jgi:hypothetical protein